MTPKNTPSHLLGTFHKPAHRKKWSMLPLPVLNCIASPKFCVWARVGIVCIGYYDIQLNRNVAHWSRIKLAHSVPPENHLSVSYHAETHTEQTNSSRVTAFGFVTHSLVQYSGVVQCQLTHHGNLQMLKSDFIYQCIRSTVFLTNPTLLSSHFSTFHWKSVQLWGPSALISINTSRTSAFIVALSFSSPNTGTRYGLLHLYSLPCHHLRLAPVRNTPPSHLPLRSSPPSPYIRAITYISHHLPSSSVAHPSSQVYVFPKHCLFSPESCKQPSKSILPHSYWVHSTSKHFSCTVFW